MRYENGDLDACPKTEMRSPSTSGKLHVTSASRMAPLSAGSPLIVRAALAGREGAVVGVTADDGAPVGGEGAEDGDEVGDVALRLPSWHDVASMARTTTSRAVRRVWRSMT